MRKQRDLRVPIADSAILKQENDRTHEQEKCAGKLYHRQNRGKGEQSGRRFNAEKRKVMLKKIARIFMPRGNRRPQRIGIFIVCVNLAELRDDRQDGKSHKRAQYHDDGDDVFSSVIPRNERRFFVKKGIERKRPQRRHDRYRQHLKAVRAASEADGK